MDLEQFPARSPCCTSAQRSHRPIARPYKTASASLLPIPCILPPGSSPDCTHPISHPSIYQQPRSELKVAVDDAPSEDRTRGDPGQSEEVRDRLYVLVLGDG
jgi:hypothetical protein